MRQRDGVYRLQGVASGPAGRLRLDVEIAPEPNRYFPPVEMRDEGFVSGYVVPALSAAARGTICVGGHCDRLSGARAYHDHNWGVWRDVTWEWGAARGASLSLLYGGVFGPRGSRAGAGALTSPFFLGIVDSLGVRQVLQFDRVAYGGALAAEGAQGAVAPARFSLRAGRGADSVRLSVEVEHALATEMSASAFRLLFFQMRGRFKLEGRMAGAAVSDTGRGFFETYRGR